MSDKIIKFPLISDNTNTLDFEKACAACGEHITPGKLIQIRVGNPWDCTVFSDDELSEMSSKITHYWSIFQFLGNNEICSMHLIDDAKGMESRISLCSIACTRKLFDNIISHMVKTHNDSLS